MEYRKKSWWAAAFSMILTAASITASAWAEPAPSPEHELEKILKGTKRQMVKQLDKQGLKLTLNDRMTGVNLEGWSTKALSDVEAEKLMAKYGVRTVTDPKDGSTHFLAPDNVGRAGILEGDIYMRLNGKVYKGLTLKGYGGNVVGGKAEQPMGSLQFDESIRDMEVSTILAENKVDTYVGVLSVERADPAMGGNPAYAKSNFVRLSRTALRMEDLIRVKGDDLVKLVDYLSRLFEDEMGRKMTYAEFDQWLIRATGDVMARKDYIRFMHASITDSNLGIGELVDLGDTWGGAGMKMPGEYMSQNAQFKGIAKRVHDNMAAADPSLKPVEFDKLYDAAYNDRIQTLRALDEAKINLTRAGLNELTQLGFTAGEAAEIVKYNLGTPDGIIDPAEVAEIKAITRDVRAILDRATTDFMRLADGSTMASYYVRGIGGATGVRMILEETREFMKTNHLTLSRDASGKIVGDVAKVEEEIRRLAVAQAKWLGHDRVVMGESVTNFSKFIARQLLEVIVKR